MEIHQATLPDAATITAFNIAMAKETEHMTLDPAVVGPGVEAVLRDPTKGVYFAAYENGKMAGVLMVTYEWSDWRNGHFWWLQSVYVHPDFRSRGVFKSLFAHVTEQAQKSANVRGFRLYVEDQNTGAIEVYHRLGMKKTYYQMLEKLIER